MFLQIEGLEQEADVVSQMMDLMEEYQTPIPPEYIAEFNVRRSYITVILGLHVNHRLCAYLHVSFSRRRHYDDYLCSVMVRFRTALVHPYRL